MSKGLSNLLIEAADLLQDVRTIEETLPEDPGVSAAANARTLVIQTKDQRPPEVGVDDKASQAQLLFGDSLDLLSYKKLGSELARRPSPPRTPPASVATPTPKATSVCRPLFVGAAEAESRDVQPPIPSTQTLDEGIADAVEKVINDLLLKSEKEAFSEQELALQDTSKETWAENQLKFVETLRGVDFGDIKESAYDFLFEPSDVQFGLTPEKDAEMSVYTEVVRSWNRTGRRSVSAAEGDSSKRQRHSDFVEDVHDRLNEIQDRVHSDVINLWGVARCMSVIGDVILADSRSNGSLVRRNTSIIFAPASSTYQAVQEEIQEWRSSSRGEEVIILRARKYLESSFRKKIGYPFTDVNDPLMNSDSGDQIFGESGAGEIQKIVNFTRHYINTFKTNMHFHLSNNGPIRQEPRAFGLPAWALIFFGLRCGDLKAAIRFAREATPPLGKFTAYLEEAFESTSRSGLPVPDLPRLSAESEAEMEAAYCSTLESEGDPFERACFCALAACNPLDDHTMVLHDVDDLLWLKVCQIRSTDEACLVAESSAMLTSTTGSSSASRLGRSRQQHRQEISSFTLRDMQERILRGESALLHLLHHSVPLSSGPQNPSFRKARLLLLCGLFEQALEVLSSSQGAGRGRGVSPTALHLAMALKQKNLLLFMTDPIHPTFFSRTRDPLTVTRVSLTRMLLEYCRRALEEHGKLADAVQYYSLLRNLRDHDYGSIFMAQLAHMLLDLRAFSVILGPLPTSTECTSADLTTRYGPSQHQHPCFGFVANPEKFLTKVALAIEGLGDLDDALVLLIYADNHKEGYRLVHDSLLMTALNSSLQTDAGHMQLVERLKNRFLDWHRTSRGNAGGFEYKNLEMLFSIYKFLYVCRKDVASGWNALELLSSVQVIPVSEEKIQECLVTAATYESLLRKLFPLLIPVLREVIQRRQMAEDDLKRSVVPFSTSQPHIVHPSSLSSVLTSFFSSLPFDLPNFGIMDLGRATRGYSSV